MDALARLVTDAGCDIIECNFSCPQMTVEGMGSDVGTNVQLVQAYTAAVKRGTTLPVLAKMTPNITDMTVPAVAAVRAGADGLAAINTIKSITGIDEETMQAHPGVMGKTAVSGYSGKAVKPIALRHIYDMAVCPELSGVPISGMGGIETWRDAVQFLAAGVQQYPDHHSGDAVWLSDHHRLDRRSDGLYEPSRDRQSPGTGRCRTGGCDSTGKAEPQFHMLSEIFAAGLFRLRQMLYFLYGRRTPGDPVRH